MLVIAWNFITRIIHCNAICRLGFTKHPEFNKEQVDQSYLYSDSAGHRQALSSAPVALGSSSLRHSPRERALFGQSTGHQLGLTVSPTTMRMAGRCLRVATPCEHLLLIADFRFAGRAH
jgi:hypothetical protein